MLFNNNNTKRPPKTETECEHTTQSDTQTSAINNIKTNIVAFCDLMGWKYTKSQLYVLEHLPRRLVLMTHRQFGKSQTAAVIATYDAVIHARSTLIVATTDSTAKLLFDKVRALCLHPYIIPHIKHNTMHELVLDNGARIRCAPSKNADNLRGGTFDNIIVDEFAFVGNDEELFNVISFTTATKSDPRIILISTPGFESGTFYQKYLEGLENADGKDTSKFTSMCFPYGGGMTYKGTDGSMFVGPNAKPNTYLITEQRALEFQEMFGGKDSPQYKQEFLCEFANVDGAYFNVDAINNLFDNSFSYSDYPERNANYFMACDLAKSNDYTVILVAKYETNDILRVVYRDRFRHKNYDEMAARIHMVANQFGVNSIAIDATGVGAALCDSFEAKYSDAKLDRYYFTAEHKIKWMSNLLLAMQRSLIACPDDDVIRNELQSFVFSVNPETKKVRLQAYGNLHDDTVVTLAMLVEKAKLICGTDSVFSAPLCSCDYYHQNYNPILYMHNSPYDIRKEITKRFEQDTNYLYGDESTVDFIDDYDGRPSWR